MEVIKLIVHECKTYWGMVYHIITSDGKGTITLQVYKEDDVLQAVIVSLSVYKNARNRGYTRALVHEAERLAKCNNCNQVLLDYESQSQMAPVLKEMYAKFGYEQYDEDDNLIYLFKNI